jgi:methylisocitrate lyase
MHAAGLAATGMMAAGPLPAAAAEQQAQASPAAAPRTMGARFRDLLQKRTPFANVSVHDVLTGRMAEMLGFPSLFIGSSAVSEFHGVPDWSLCSDTERLEFSAHIAQHVNIPSLVDLDQGGMNALTLYRSVRAHERAGIAAVHLTDDLGAAGTTTGTIPLPQMIDRIHAAVDARSDMVVSLRCTGWTRDGREKTLERAAAFIEAGAETIWFIGAPLEQSPSIADAIKVPLTAQFVFDTPMARARELKVTVATYASLVQNIAQSAAYEALVEFKNTGMWAKSAKGQRLGQTIPADVRAQLLESTDLTERGKKYNLG